MNFVSTLAIENNFSFQIEIKKEQTDELLINLTFFNSLKSTI
jgi:hypothetical protein